MSTELYEEEQRLLRPWHWPLLLVALGGIWYLFLQRVWDESATPTHPYAYILMIVFGIGLPVLLALITLNVRVSTREVVIRFRPIWTRTVRVADIETCRARAYRPILEFGGWGIRYGARMGGWAYTVSGSRGVQLDLKNGKKLLIGSAEADRLAQAIVRAMDAR